MKSSPLAGTIKVPRQSNSCPLSSTLLLRAPKITAIYEGQLPWKRNDLIVFLTAEEDLIPLTGICIIPHFSTLMPKIYKTLINDKEVW